jgi:hypothetical protein
VLSERDWPRFPRRRGRPGGSTRTGDSQGEKENDAWGAGKLAWIEHTHAHGEGGTGTLGVDGRKRAEGKI